jgi:WD40 repeat protein
VPESIPANIRKVTVTPDSKWLLAAGSSENIYMWDLVNNKRFSDLTGHKGEIFSLALSADNKWVAAAGLSSEISIWQPKIPDKTTIDQNSVENPVKIPTR